MKANGVHDINLRVRDYERRIRLLRAATWSERTTAMTERGSQLRQSSVSAATVRGGSEVRNETVLAEFNPAARASTRLSTRLIHFVRELALRSRPRGDGAHVSSSDGRQGTSSYFFVGRADATHACDECSRIPGPLRSTPPREASRPDRPVLHRITSDQHFREVVDHLGDPTISDRYAEVWLSEQALIRNGGATAHASESGASSIGPVGSVTDGVWVYFPWRHHLIHLPERSEFLELLYARNHPCISRSEQQALAELHVGVVGLSVGSSIARALVMTGVQRLRIADFDVIAPSNNNRMGAGSVLNVGTHKATVLARDLYEFNPYLDLQVLDGRLHDANVHDFLTGLDVVIDHMDGLSMKLRLRQEARRLGVPVIMATDVGVSPIFDVELPEDDAFFGGRVDAPALDSLSQITGDRRDWVKAAAQVIGVDNMPEPVLVNFLAAYRGQHSYVSQLGITGYLAAAQVAFMVLELARGRGSRLARFRRLSLEQDDLVDTCALHQLRLQFRAELGFLGVPDAC